MMTSDSITRKYLYIIFVIAVLAECFAIVLVILLTAFDYIGLDGDSPGSSVTCTTTYLATKYAQLLTLVSVSFICSIVTLVFFTVVLILLIRIVLKATKSEESNIFVAKCNKIAIYIFAFIALIASIAPLAYYLNFLIQLDGCSSYDNVKIGIVLAVAIILSCLLLTFIILLCVFLNQSVEKNYGQVQRNSTLPVEPAQQPKYVGTKYLEKEQTVNRKQPEVYEKKTPQQLSKHSPPKKIINSQQQQQSHTKQHLYSSPSKQPTVNTYSKRLEQPYTVNPPQRKYTPSKDPPLILEPKTYKKQPYIGQFSPSKESELVYSKAYRKEPNNDDQNFGKVQSRFMSNYGGRPILASGIEDSSHQKRQVKDRFRQDQQFPRKNVQLSPKKGRQNNLLNYIRGKYAD